MAIRSGIWRALLAAANEVYNQRICRDSPAQLARIDRYLLREIALPFLISIALVVVAMFLLQARRLAAAALGMGLSIEDAGIIFASALPPFLIQAVPVAYLLSVLVGLGRMASDLELTALRSTGASPFRIARMPL